MIILLLFPRFSQIAQMIAQMLARAVSPAVLRTSLCAALLLVLPLHQQDIRAQEISQTLSQGILQYKISAYKTKDGLSANATKALVQDENNILWIGLDEGLSRYDGKQFRNFRHSLPSQYVKYLYKLKSGRILVSHDLGIAEIRETADTIVFAPVLRGERTETDSAVNYPKQLFEQQGDDGHDGRGSTLWVAESKSVVRFRNGVLKRYRFPERCQTNSFLRSFSFVADGNGSFVVCSQTGYCFWYDQQRDTFVELALPDEKPLEAASDLLNIKPGVIWLGYAKGIMELRLDANGTLLAATKRTELNGVSTLHRTAEGRIFVGTWFSGLFTIEQVSEQGAVLSQLRNLPFRTVNFLASSSNGEMWGSSDEGIALMKPSPVATVEFGENSGSYIQSVIADDSLAITYTSNGMAMYALSRKPDNSFAERELMRIRGTDILCLALTKRSLWGGTTDGKLLRIARSAVYAASQNSPKTASNLPFETIPTLSRTGRNPTLFSMFVDSRGDLWACGELDAGAIRVREMPQQPSQTPQTPSVELYAAERGLTGIIRSFRESPSGVLYGAGRSRTRGQAKQQYLFRYDAARDRFEDLSKPLPPEAGDAFEVNDMFVRADDDLWLCSSVGLFHQSTRGGAVSIQKVPIYYAPTSEEVLNFKAITQDASGNLWIGSSHGIVVLSAAGSYFFLNESGGLPTNEIAFRTMFWNKKAQEMWVGTVKGLVNVPSLTFSAPATPAPRLTSLLVNGGQQPLAPLLAQQGASLNSTPLDSKTFNSKTLVEYPHSASLQLGFLAVVFGETTLSYQYRILSADGADGADRDTAWSATTQEPRATFLTLPSGTYTIEVRALQSGMYRWSAPLLLRFSIALAWHERWWWRMLMLAGFLGFCWGIVQVYTRRLQQQQIVLQNLIEERTRDLNVQNEQLKELNQEKSEILGVVAHDLRNPITSIMLSGEILTDFVESQRYDNIPRIVGNMNIVAERMLEIVRNLLHINSLESGGMELRSDTFDAEPILRHIIEQYTAPAAAKNITLRFAMETDDSTVFADESAVERVLENLISNAVKYSPHGKNIFIRLQSSSEAVRIEIQDEGPGISADDQKKLFGKFARLSAQPTGGEHSTGLGLSIVKKLVEAMNGRVWCESTLGNGATFVVELPRA
jgi:signal transduction histidine kinase/ligand-binding sensor domain-containing protein